MIVISTAGALAAPIATATVPAAAYLRRSTDRQEQSIGDQRAEIRRFADEHG